MSASECTHVHVHCSWEGSESVLDNVREYRNQDSGPPQDRACNSENVSTLVARSIKSMLKRCMTQTNHKTTVRAEKAL